MSDLCKPIPEGECLSLLGIKSVGHAGDSTPTTSIIACWNPANILPFFENF